MKAILFIFLFAFSLSGMSQGTQLPLKKAYYFLFSNVPVYKTHLDENSCADAPALLFCYKPVIPVSTVSEGLPMFCALEKKLRKTCNVWIKIRLSEHQ